MKYRIVSLTSLLTISFLSVPALANPPGHRPPPPPPPHHAPPPPHYAPPPQVHHAPPPPQYRTMAPLSRKSYASYNRNKRHAGRSWRMGQKLPRTAVYQEVSAPQTYYLAPPPRNHRYVRVGNDILLLAIGTGLIVNALYDIVH
ncbi:MAG: RcnB family protein [Betaproteobacteria bacterium]|nr:RcnB family protein [Betaproteobacteria bacterium]